MPLVLQPARTRLTASAGQTQFQYNFSDAGATISPIIVRTLAVGATTYVEQTIIVDYTLDRSTKTITFLVGLPVDTIVLMERATNRTRDVSIDPASTVTGAILNRDEEQSFRYKQELEDQLSRRLGQNDREDQWLAGDRKIITLADATNPQDAMNQRTTQGLISASGNLAPPGGGTVGFVLTAIDATTYQPRDRGVPIPAAGEINFLLTATSAAEGGYQFNDRGVPIPGTGDIDKLLQVTAAGEGGYSFTMRLPSPISGDGGKVATVIDADDAQWSDLPAAPQANAIINGDFRIAQKGTSFTAATTPANGDDTYLLDRWILLADGADTVDVSQELVTLPNGSFAGIRLTVTPAGVNRKFGQLQIIEARNTAAFFKLATASLSFKARTNTGAQINNLRAAVVSWTGDADVVTSDIVSAWNAAGADPTLVANAFYENTPSNLLLVLDTFTEFKIENIPLAPATGGINNLMLFIWSDDVVTASGDLVIITDVRLEPGPLAHDLAPVPMGEELANCQRYWQQSYVQGVAPGTATSNGERATMTSGGGVTAATIQVDLSVVMRTQPTGTAYSPVTGASGQMRDDPGGVDVASEILGMGDASFRISNTAATTDQRLHRVQYTVDAEL